MNLRLDWCSHEAAKYAVENWHYSKVMPVGKLVKIGVWEENKFIGVVIFGRGACAHIGRPYKISQTAGCELVRIALQGHSSPVSRIVAIAIKFLRVNSPGLRLVISYADPEQGHHGGIYQAGNWLYCGRSQSQSAVIYNGKVMHKKSAMGRFGTIKGMKKSPITWKHKYLFALDSIMQKQIMSLSKPYPKRGTGETDNAAHSRAQTGGASPTVPLLNHGS